MRWLKWALLVVMTGTALGCGGGDKAIMPTRQLTDEEKQKVKEEDKSIADEESQGKQLKGKKR